MTMFYSSTHRNHWIFASEEDLKIIRQTANESYIQGYLQSRPNFNREKFLTYEEEQDLIHYYEGYLKDVVLHFNPALPNNVITSAFHFYKRFYLKKSVMDSHPKYISMTSVYLACKTEEFNLPVTQIARNINWGIDVPKITEILIHNEMPIIESMKFHLIIHNPFDTAENFVKHIRCYSEMDFDTKKKDMDNFIFESLLTDIPLLYSPQQIALAAIIHAARKEKSALDDYIFKVLIPDTELELFAGLIKHIRKSVRDRGLKPIPTNVDHLEQKLTLCRNEDNNPFSAEYAKKLKAELYDDDEEFA